MNKQQGPVPLSEKSIQQPDLAVDGETALARASQQAYDVIFLDVVMPGMDGFEILLKFGHHSNRATPVVFCDRHAIVAMAA